MTENIVHAGDESRRLFGGTLRVFLAESLIVPAGLLIAAVLTRRLGPEEYGRYVLAATLAVWVEWTVVTVFNRATVKIISSTKDWQAVGATVMRLHLAAGVAAAILLLALAPALASALGEPTLSTPLRVFALGVPLFSLAQAHRAVLVGIGGFKERAWTSAARWGARLICITLPVVAGYGVVGAAWGSVAASAVELAVARLFVRVPLWRARGIHLREWWAYAAPLFLSALALQLYDKLDLFALKALGAATREVGLYGAALNLSLLPGVFAMSLAPLLVSSVSRALREGDEASARALSAQALRAAVLTLPAAALVAGCGGEVAALFFGAEFAPAGAPLGPLLLGAWAVLLLAATSGVMTAYGRASWTLAAAGPLPFVSLAAYLFIIPRFGANGAVLAKAAIALACTAGSVIVVRRAWGVAPSAATLARSLLVAAGAYALAALWPTGGVLVLLKLALLSIAAALALVASGEFGAGGVSGAARRAVEGRRVRAELQGDGGGAP